MTGIPIQVEAVVQMRDEMDWYPNWSWIKVRDDMDPIQAGAVVQVRDGRDWHRGGSRARVRDDKDSHPGRRISQCDR